VSTSLATEVLNILFLKTKSKTSAFKTKKIKNASRDRLETRHFSKLCIPANWKAMKEAELALMTTNISKVSG